MQILTAWLNEERQTALIKSKSFYDDGNFKNGLIEWTMAEAYENVLRKITGIR
jgi:hypothetical protein